MSSAPIIGRRIAVQGTVQGVGFRPWVYTLAHQLHLRGTVKNGPEGVSIDAFGDPGVLDQLLVRLEAELPPAARIDRLAWAPLESEPPTDFTIIASDHHGAARASIPADLAMCDACRAEIHDPRCRRFHYPFTNCTHCGPRFSIATAIPYDRPNTTMARFAMCADCLAEYEDPLDRRFHAQPIACPACGPRLSWRDANGTLLDVPDVLERAAHRLLEGDLVALRGLGGFHLACDALNDAAVKTLRLRKRRDEKPFAVMVPDLAAALRFAELGARDVELLTSAARPIVLAPLRPGLAPSIAPGLEQVGLFLPYTPMHELLMHRVQRPLVMTSGNRSDEPMAVDNDDALERLSGIADGFVTHDRPIATRADDSVARVVAGAPMVLRRARGWVPESLKSPVPFDAPVLAVGGQLKNTFCVGKGDRLTLGPHVGDLDDCATFADFERMTDRVLRFLDADPRVIAHDRHPDYQTTAYALARPASTRVAVQHHHAHVAAVMAEHGLTGAVLGVAFDGTGWGDDGSAWGGEILRARYEGFERLATFRPILLAGGEQAIRHPWRLALAVLDDAFDGAPPLERLRLFQRVPAQDVANVRRVLETRLQVVPAHGVGRLFDAAAALVLRRPDAAFEAQLAMMLEGAAAGDAEPFPFEVDKSRVPWSIDLRPMWRALVEALLQGVPAALVSARFHATLAAATSAVVGELLERDGARRVVLSGGCFANDRLAKGVLERLGRFDVYLPRRVPPGDGGLALGQAVIAAASTKGAR